MGMPRLQAEILIKGSRHLFKSTAWRQAFAGAKNHEKSETNFGIFNANGYLG
jgi:hypothetical protein